MIKLPNEKEEIFFNKGQKFNRDLTNSVINTYTQFLKEKNPSI